MKEKKSKRGRKRRKVTINKILTPVVMILFVIALLLLMNIHSLCHAMNRNSYVTLRATVVEETVDPYALVVPMVNLRYKYESVEYEDKKFFVLEPFFGIEAEAGSTIMIYVNKAVPNHFMIQTKFFRNWINWLLLLFMAVFISLLIRRCRWAVLNHREKRAEKKRKRNKEDNTDSESDEKLKVSGEKTGEKLATNLQETPEWQTQQQIEKKLESQFQEQEMKKHTAQQMEEWRRGARQQDLTENAWHMERRESDEQ